MAPPKQTNRKKNEVMIALLGVTGAGKSTFASIASGNQLEIGHGVDPCTQQPSAVHFELDGRRVTLIDTPGFDDDKRSDLQILEAIFKWMTREGYLRHHLLDGLIFLHPITLNRVGGSERKRTRLLQEILGPKAYRRIIIATTMWGDLRSEEMAKSRLEGRISAGGVWNAMYSQGALMMPHDNTKESAHKIIQKIVETSDKHGKVRSQLESELVRDKGRVSGTSAGKELKLQILEELNFLKEHRDELQKEKPPRPSKEEQERKSQKWKEWRRWREEMLDLDRRIDAKEQDLKKLDSMVVRIKKFFGSFFGSHSKYT
ncbi:GTP-binding protein A [Madurella mycetomatis]|uniref:GTP-binding protein A n=1 Tax=Madurella mycetomatis TaxID=100816 RepID=A0A175VRP6_9PEZI|nr:GTP-binding protein A [Madurella mycetomatis]